MMIANIIAIVLFVMSIIIFNIAWVTDQTREVLLYFIPDMLLTLENIYITLIMPTFASKEFGKLFLSFWLVKLSINLGYYINIASAVFYILLPLDMSLLHTGLMDPFEKLWGQYSDIMKFKAAATIHALTLKWHADLLQKRFTYLID